MKDTNKMNNNIEKWPKDWEFHIIRGLKSYFGTEESIGIAFVDARIHTDKIVGATFDVDNSTIRLGFKIREKSYGATLKIDQDNYMIGDLFYVLDRIYDDSKETGIWGTKLSTIIPDYIFALYADNILSLAKQIEEEITNDYWKRGNDNDDDGDDSNIPIIPTGSFEKTPVISAR